ncbi:MAG: MFS transporter [Amylibacter sp.]|nr:MFS transporter [Amylibacter sp.]
MGTVLKNSWPLFLGMMLLMLGNGLQGTLLGIRGALEGFSANTMAWVMSGYFIGFLGGSRMAPEMIRRVGHVRVFAALASLVSAALILYAAVPNVIAWFGLRILIGFCFSGVYVVAESWLNDSATNETRGQTLSLYLIVQMIGIVAAQGVLNFADPGGYTLFIISSVLVSVSFAPILLSISPAPMFKATKPMSFRRLYATSPTAVVGTLLLGSIFSALFGMASVYGTQKGLDVRSITLFVAMIYIGGMICQYPIGWVSDRMDRRKLIIYMTIVGAVAMAIAPFFTGNIYLLMLLSFILGGICNPLYSLYLAYMNDYLEPDDMAAASGGLIFISGCGAIGGPFLVGWMMTTYGADSFFIYLAVLLGLSAAWALFRSTVRDAPNVADTGSYAHVAPGTSVVAVELATEVAIEMAEEEGDT